MHLVSLRGRATVYSTPHSAGPGGQGMRAKGLSRPTAQKAPWLTYRGSPNAVTGLVERLVLKTLSALGTTRATFVTLLCKVR